MSVEPEPKVLLQNKVAKANEKLQEATAVANAKGELAWFGLAKLIDDPMHRCAGPEAQKLRQVFLKYQDDPRLGDPDEVMNVSHHFYSRVSLKGLQELSRCRA
jgi:hypothetical protein